MRTSYMRYLIMKYQYHSQNAIKDFTILDQYNKENAYWADLFTRVKSCNKKIGMNMIWYIFQYSISGVIYFSSTNSLLLFGDINLELMKNHTSHQSP